MILNTIEMTGKVTDLYMKVLSSLSTEEQLEIISKLAELIKNKKNDKRSRKKPDLRTCFSGDWSDIELDRHFDRDVEVW